MIAWASCAARVRRPADDFVDRVRASAVELAGARAGRIIGDEIGMVVLAVVGPFLRAREGENRFSHHRENGRTALMIVIIGLIACEMGAMHVALVDAHPVLAWTLTSSSAWAALWLLGDLHAHRVRRTHIEGDQLHVRVGLGFSPSTIARASSLLSDPRRSLHRP